MGNMKKFTKQDVIDIYNKEVAECAVEDCKSEMLPQWLNQSMGHLTVALSNGETIEGIPDDVKARLDFYSEWVQTERYISGPPLKEVRDILVRPEIMDFVFAMMRRNVENGIVTPRSYFDTEIE